MSRSSGLVPLRLQVTSSKGHYIYFPVEKNGEGRDVRRLMIFRESKVEYVKANEIKPKDDEEVQCYIKVGINSKQLIYESTKYANYLSEKQDPEKKMNHIMDVWAKKDWLFDDKGNCLSSFPSAPPEKSKDKPLPSSLPAPSEQLRANTDTPKNTKEKKKLFGNTLPPMSKEQIASLEASRKAKDIKSVSSNLPTSSKPTNANSERRDKKVGPFLVSDSESESDPGSLFVSQRKPTHPKSAADDKKRREERERERAAQRKKPVRNPSASDEDDKPQSSDSRFNTKTTGKTREPTKPAKKTTTNTDLAGDKSSRREGRERPKPEKVGATGESSRGIVRTRNDRSKSPDKTSRKPEVQRPGRDNYRTSSRPPAGVAVKGDSTSTFKSRSSRQRNGNELASDAGIYLKSRSQYKGPQKNYLEVEDDSNRPPTAKELQDMELEDAQRMWKKKHGTEL
ncbi:hypothetical protein BPAE_0084g00120 [Botrytis paeoniae]|uniref:Uncharacterized protein n=1 Tax=Botrytis paeoniae TaxID=278948 RepID=A0A4Z1FL96_9HELO|nr:hypothetical protein BPAE_0084g00120 [Botrytis paeoniae]